MIVYVLRRLSHAVLTVFGVMVITFVLFRGMAGDIASAHLGQKAKQQQRADWLHRHGYDRPLLVNVHRRLRIVDLTEGSKPFWAQDVEDDGPAEVLALFAPSAPMDAGSQAVDMLLGRYVAWLSEGTSVDKLVRGHGRDVPRRSKASKNAGGRTAQRPGAPEANGEKTAISGKVKFHLKDGSSLEVDLTAVKTCGDVIDRINTHPENRERIRAGITRWSAPAFFDTQFVDHLVGSVTFRTRSLLTNEKLTKTIADRAPVSLALTVPAMAFGWLAGLAISSFVAYYRNTAFDKIVVFLCVLGMCIPFLAFMIYGQWFMFAVAPARAYGLFYRSNIYIPILIMVIAGLGGSVRFYRTIILDQVNQDYVRTARAKGAPLPDVLFKHVLKNCMLPILTHLIMALPFLIMGSLLVETYFGIPGLGDLMISSISNRDEPIISAMVFLSALIYTLGVIVTDISYAVFDPRIRLR